MALVRASQIGSQLGLEEAFPQLTRIHGEIVQSRLSNPGMRFGLTDADFSRHILDLASTVTGLSMSEYDYMAREVLPVVLTQETTLRQVVEDWNAHSEMQEYSELGQIRQTAVRVSEVSSKMVRFLEGCVASIETASSPEGAKLFATQLVRVAIMISRQLAMQGFAAIARATEYSHVFQRAANASQYDLAIERDIEGFAMANKYKDGLTRMVTRGKVTMMQRNVQAVPTHLICPDGKVTSILNSPMMYGSFQTAGEGGALRLMTDDTGKMIGGVKVVPGPRVPVGSASDVLSKTQRVRTLGSFTPLSAKMPGMPANSYGAIQVLDGAKGSWETVSMVDAFVNSGYFVPVGAPAANMWRFNLVGFRLMYPVGRPQGSEADPFVVKEGNNYSFVEGLVNAGGVAISRTMRDWIYGADRVPAADPNPAIPAWGGLSGMVIRVFETLRMDSAFLVKGGEDTGITAQSPTVLTFAEDVSKNALQLNASVSCTAIVKRSEYVMRLPDAFYAGYIYGTNVKPISPEDMPQIQNHGWQLDDDRSPAAIYTVFPAEVLVNGVPRDTLSTLPDRFNLKGRSPFDDASVLEYPGCDTLVKRFGFGAISNDQLVPGNESVPVAPYVCRSSFRYQTADGHTVHEEGTTHHGPKEDRWVRDIRRDGDRTVDNI